MLIQDLKKRQDDKDDDDKKVSSLKQKESTTTATAKWIMCKNHNEGSAATIGYNCESRPYMTVLLIISILIFIILRKSTFIKNWVSSNQEKLQEQADEEEGLMQRVF